MISTILHIIAAFNLLSLIPIITELFPHIYILFGTQIYSDLKSSLHDFLTSRWNSITENFNNKLGTKIIPLKNFYNYVAQNIIVMYSSWLARLFVKLILTVFAPRIIIVTKFLYGNSKSSTKVNKIQALAAISYIVSDYVSSYGNGLMYLFYIISIILNIFGFGLKIWSKMKEAFLLLVRIIKIVINKYKTFMEKKADLK